MHLEPTWASREFRDVYWSMLRNQYLEEQQLQYNIQLQECQANGDSFTL